MWLVSPLPEKVYATSAHPKWLRPMPTALLCAAVNLVGMYIAAMATQQKQTESTSVFLVLAGLSFAHRLVVYAAIHWLWYVIDYCVIMCGIIFWHLWQFSNGETAADDEEATARLFVLSAGIGSFVLMLNTKLLLHHPECAASWWIHVGVPIWLSLAMRNWAGFNSTGLLTTVDIIVIFLRSYLPWWLGYFGFIIIRPSLPFALDKWPYLVGDYMGANPTFFHKFKFMAGHGIFALLGGVVGAFAYSNLLVHQLWVALGTASSAYHGLKFYRSCKA